MADAMVADCLADLHAELAGVKFLGSYPGLGRGRPGHPGRGRPSRAGGPAEWLAALAGRGRVPRERLTDGARSRVLRVAPGRRLPWPAPGGMAERTNARLLKSREVQASGGSNPPPSAQIRGPLLISDR